VPEPPSSRLRALGLSLPPAPKPAGSYAPAVVFEAIAWVSGQVVLRDGKAVHAGLVGRDVSLEEAKAVARDAALQGLSALAAAVGSIDKVQRIAKVNVYVAVAPGFDRPHEVANGATELLIELFGEAGRPARATVGVAALPFNAPVEVEFVAVID
jgi:enamine deaminase RidA (YjgF/YER057c/UK114 family)